MPRCLTQDSPVMVRWREASMLTQLQNARYTTLKIFDRYTVSNSKHLDIVIIV